MTDPENVAAETGGAPPGVVPPPISPLSLAPRDIWKARDLLLFIAFIPFALFVSNLAVLAGYVALRPLAGWRPKFGAVQSETIFLLVQQCLFYVLILGFLLMLARIGHRQPLWRSLGWRKPTRKQVAEYVLGGVGLAAAVTLALSIRPDVQEFPLEKLFSSRAASFALGAFAIAVAPAVEELVFRGLLFAVVEHAAGWRVAIVVTALLFAGLHIPEYWRAWHHIVMIVVVGLVFSLARGMSGSLAPSIILHIGYNACLMTGLFFSTQQFRNAQGLWMG